MADSQGNGEQGDSFGLPGGFEGMISDWVTGRKSSFQPGQGNQAVGAAQGGWGFGHLRLANDDDTGDEILMGHVTVAVHPPPAFVGAEGVPAQPIPPGGDDSWTKHWPPGSPMEILAVLVLANQGQSLSHTVTYEDLGCPDIDDLKDVVVMLRLVDGSQSELCMRIGVEGQNGTVAWAPDSQPL